VEILCLAAAAAATLYFGFYLAVLAEESLRFNDLSSGMIAVPLWIPQASMVAGTAILATALLDDLVAVLTGRPPSYAGRGENLLGQTPDVTGEV
jgi:TRAP-type C4-dicarboxylate transport system permease small subunit